MKAAQIDPRRADDTQTPGAHESVLAVEQALDDEGLLATRWVDGYFGTKTVEAYAAWQRSLGYSGLAANGLPGRASLTALGCDRYTVTRVIGPGEQVDWGPGRVVDTRTRDMLDRAERPARPDLGPRPGLLQPRG